MPLITGGAMPDIAGERARLAAQGLSIVRRETWGGRFDYTTDRPVERPATRLFLHISVTLDHGDLTGDEHTDMRTIERIGIERFPNTGISYNATAFDTGRLYEGQPLSRRGAHTVNDKQLATCPVHGGGLTAPSWNLNVNSRSLVLPQMLADDVTDAQIDAAARWAAACIRAGEVARGTRWHGHRCVANKDCPGAKGYARIPELQKLTEHYTANGLEDDMALSDADKAWMVATIDARIKALFTASARAGWNYRNAAVGDPVDMHQMLADVHDRTAP